MGESMHPELLPWYAAGSVSPEEAREIAAHLESCENCRKELKDLRSLGATLQAEAALAPEVFGAGEQRASWLRGSGMASWLLAAAMLVFGLAVGIVGSRIVGESVPGVARQPIEVVTLTPATRGGDGVPELRGAGPWALAILLPSSASPGRYDVWLEAEDGSRRGDSTIVSESDGNGWVGFHLEPLPADIYTVVLRAQGTEVPATYRYALRVPDLSDD
jgi:hypothetical protein